MHSSASSGLRRGGSRDHSGSKSQMEDGKKPLAAELPDPSNQAKLRLDIWFKCLVATVFIVSPALVLGLFRDVNNKFDTEDWDVDIVYQVALPGFVVYLITLFVMSRVTTAIGFSMLRESGENISIKDSARTNMTNSGIVLALFASMLLAMWQADGQGAGCQRTEMYYRMFLLFGIEACTRGIIMVSIFLVFLEPLDDQGSRQFAVDNLLYLGEPTTCIAQTMVYFMQACILWVFYVDGKVAGTLSYLIFAFCVLRVSVVAKYLEVWENPLLPQDVRERRTQKLSKAKEVDGTHVQRLSSSSQERAPVAKEENGTTGTLEEPRPPS